MSTFYDDVPKMKGIRGDYAMVAFVDDMDPPRVMIRAVDSVAEEAVSVVFTPAQARDLARAITEAANKAEGAE